MILAPGAANFTSILGLTTRPTARIHAIRAATSTGNRAVSVAPRCRECVVCGDTTAAANRGPVVTAIEASRLGVPAVVIRAVTVA